MSDGYENTNEMDLDSKWYTGEVQPDVRQNAISILGEIREMQTKLISVMKPHSQFMKEIREKFLSDEVVDFSKMTPEQVSALLLYAIHGSFSMAVSETSELLEGGNDGK